MKNVKYYAWKLMLLSVLVATAIMVAGCGEKGTGIVPALTPLCKASGMACW